MLSRLFRNVFANPNKARNHRQLSRAIRQQQARRLLLEKLEVREVMDATPHQIAAANINVVQNDEGNAATSVSLSLPYSVNDFRLRTGSSRADYFVQIGSSASDDLANGILLTSIRNNGRDNGEATPAVGVVHYGTSAIEASGGGYYIPVFDTSLTTAYAGGNEYNFNLSAAYFPYADGWLGGFARNAANGGPITTLTASPGLTLGTHFVDNGGGQSTVDLRSLGISSLTDGVLIVNGGKNEDNFALSHANADGTWSIFNKDNQSDKTAYEQDPVAFVYVPLSNTAVIAGKFAGNLSPLLQNAPFTVTHPATGTYHLEIPGQSPATGVLIISAEGGVGNNIDNPVSFVANGNGWDIQSRDLPNMGLQDLQPGDPVISFVFVPGKTPGVTFSPASGLLTTEAGGTATFAVTLDTPPTADVMLSLASSNAAEGTLSVSTLTFTPSNWNVPQTVTVTGQDDVAMDGTVQYAVTGTLSSTDLLYNGHTVPAVLLANADNEAGITVNPISGLQTTEAGGKATFKIQLNSQPTANVVIGLASSNGNEGVPSVSALTFTAANWNVAQTVTVTGVDDSSVDGTIGYSVITAAAASSDPIYNGLDASDVSLVNLDNDTAGVLLSTIAAVTIQEGGPASTYTVRLKSAPTSDVTITLSSTDGSEGAVSPAQLVFNAANWNIAQSVAITPVDDFTRDGSVTFKIVAVTTSGDPLYSGAAIPDKTVTTLDNESTITLPGSDVLYAIGSPAYGLFPTATITDIDSADFDTGTLTISQTGISDLSDRIEIADNGIATGKIGVSGSVVSYGGIPIGSFTGGAGLAPLIVTFNSASTPAAVQALLRAVTFRNVSGNPYRQVRTIAVVLNDGDGGESNTATRNVQLGLANVSVFQEGVNSGYGIYSGQADIQLSEANPNVALPAGNGTQLFLDYPDVGVTNTTQVLMRYDNIFGSGPGQIPLGATIVSAELVLNVTDAGDGGTMHRLATPWSADTETWNSFASGEFPRNSQGGVQTNDGEARAINESQWGVIDGSGDSGTGRVSIGVTPDLAAWANGETNNGWLFTGWTEKRNGTGISPGESTDPTLRPTLRVTWVPAGVQVASFRQGVNGYTGAQDALLQQANPDVNFGTDIALAVSDTDDADQQQVLIKFGNIIGTGPGQIPPGSQVHAAVLTTGNTTTGAMGDGGRFFSMNQSWSQDTATWNSVGNGIQPNGIEASNVLTAQAGSPSLNPNVQGGFTPFDVTTDLQAWVSGTKANEGWAILPWAGGTDDWGFISSDAFVEAELPQLRVFFTPPGVSVTPTSGLVTRETGTGSTFTIQLDTAPLADVTIPLLSSDSSEGAVSPSSVTFTPNNWNLPQTVTVTGVDDAISDGPVAYSITTGPAISTDVNYSGLEAADVSVTNADNDSSGVTVQPKSGLATTEAGGTATFTVVLNQAPSADVVIQLSSSNPAEGVVSSAPSLTFTGANWNVPQTVTVTGTDDPDIDGPTNYTIVTSAVISTDQNYNGFDPDDVTISNQDNDVAGVTITPTTGLVTTEAGGTATFTIVLNARPSSNVIFGLNSSDPSEGNVSPTAVVFSSLNWNVPQTITITGVSDVGYDGAVNYSIVSAAITSSDANYNGLDPEDVAVTNVDVVPLVTLGIGAATYGVGGPAVGIDGQAVVSDLDSANFNGGNLSVQLTNNGAGTDRIQIRNVGTGLGQISVSGDTVFYSGIAIGTMTGGLGTTPLVIGFNTAATPAAAQALLRSVTFSSVSVSPSTAARTVQVTLNDGNGHTSQAVSRTINVGLLRASAFQEGVDNGLGLYGGAVDAQILQSQPNSTFPSGSTSNGLSVVGGANVASQALLRFDNLFGDGPGQIPYGALITSAELVLDVNTSGSGPRFNRLLQSWNESTATWNSFANGIQPNDVEARSIYDATLNNGAGAAANTTTGSIGVGVTADLQAWSNGEANNGWAILPALATNTANFTFSPSEAAALADRPKLKVSWVPAGTAVTSFRDGVNGYTGTVDTQLTQATPTGSGGAATDLNVDFTDVNGANAVHVLLKFEDAIGSTLGQVPAGAIVYAATLTLPAMGSNNAPGDGGRFFPMLKPWTNDDTWNSLSNGISADGTEASATSNAQAGNASLTPDAQAGFNVFDVTTDVQTWVNGTTANQGWAILPWTNGSNGWIFSSSETATIKYRPMLTVYYSLPPGVTVSESDGSTAVVEGGATDTVSIVLNAQPTADVTITANPGNQLTTNVATLTFTPANWNVAQSFTVTGVNDGVAEGTHSGTLSFTATSGDATYNAIGIGSVAVNISDPSLLKVTSTSASVSGFSFAFDRPVRVDLLNLYDSAAGTLGSPDVVVVGATVGAVSGTLLASPDNQSFTFVATGGRLAPDTYTMTLRGAADGFVDASGNALDGDADTIPGGNYTATFVVAALDPNELLLSIPDFVRGAGQQVNLPTTSDAGIPLTLSSGRNVTSVTFDLKYNPAILNVTAFTSALVGTSVSFSTPAVGVARVTVTSATEFSTATGPIELGRFVANVPDDAPYAAKQLLDLTDLSALDLTSAARPITGDDGVQISSYIGDLNGNGTYSGADTTLLQRLIVGSGSGLTAYQLADPRLLTDISSNGSLTGGDTTLLQRLIVGTAVTQVPALPTGIVPGAPTGPDPQLYIPTTLTGAPGQTVTVPVMLKVTEAAGISVASVDLAIQYDATKFTLSNFRVGELLGGPLGGFAFATNTATPGVLKVTISAATGPNLAFNAEGSVFNFDVTVIATATLGDSIINLLQNSGSTATAVADNNVDELTLVPAPTNGSGDSIDGHFLITTAGGVTITPLAGLTTTEAGGDATFTIVLNSQPTANVTIPLSSSDATEGSVAPASVTFTAANWNVPQTVTVTGVDDAIVDGNIAYTIVTGAATSTDPAYAGLNTADVSVTNTDNDAAGVTVTPTTGLTTDEGGGTATFTIVLNSQPTADVTIPLSSSDATEGSVAPASVTFTAANWNVPQTVTATGVDDAIVDGNIAYTIVTGAATSTDPAYAGLNATDVSVTNTDNDAAGVTVTPTSGLTTTEAGGTATFTIVLNSQPTADVTIPLSSSDATESSVAPASVTFTAANWNVPQTVTVTGVDDAIVDGSVAYTIVTGAATSTDPAYAGLNAADVSLTNADNDAAGVTITPTSGLTTTEAGGTATFTIVLNSQPTGSVTIPLTSSDATEGTVSPASVNFTTANWNVPQTVTVTGVDDAIVDGSVAYTIVTGAATSTDVNYAGLNTADVSVTNTDNDVATPADVTITPTSGLTTNEAGGTATFTIVLNSQPTGSVTIPLTSSDATEGTVSPVSVTFTTANWNVPQTVTAMGVDDAIVDGNIAYTIVTGAATSTDPAYNGLNATDVSVTNTDNDVAGVTITPTSGLTTTEAGGTATFTIVLNSQPTADVTIPLSSSDATEGSVAPASVTFTAANWNVPQTVTVTGVDDAIVDGSVAYTIMTGAATSTDLNYAGLNAADVSVTNTDNDVATPAGVTITPTSGLTTTEAGGTAAFTIVLNSQPTGSVTIPLTSSDTTEGTAAPASVTFTSANWNVPQTVTVTGVDDAIVDGNIAYTIVTGAATSSDPAYAGLNATDVSVTNTDNDVAMPAGVTVTPTSGLTTTEAGGTATFAIVLNSQPTGSVTIPLSSNDLTEGTVSPASVTFTTANWNVPQTVTVTGVDDSIVDGNIAYTIMTGAATSTDLNYAGLNAADVSVTNTDNDVATPAGVTITPTSGLTTTEAGGTATFTIVLNSQPTGSVTIPFSSSDATEGTVSAASVTFTTANWNVPQTVTISGIDDAIVDGNIAYTILTGAATSTDVNYAGLNAADVTVTNTDNDVVTPATLDFGDAPNSYGTTLASNGPRHAVGPLFLGAGVTAEADGTPSATANSDADDGVILPSAILAGMTVTSTITASQAGLLNAWIDYNQNGLFEASEAIAVNYALAAGVNTLTFNTPSNAVGGGTFARFRVSTASGLSPTGAAADGEVEDYTLTMVNTPNGQAVIIDDPQNPGQKLLVVRGTASTDVITVTPVGSSTQVVMSSGGVRTFSNSSFQRVAVFGGAGNDVIIISPLFTKPTMLSGDEGADSIYGGAGDDLIYGGSGNDVIFGRNGNDIIYGNQGSDFIYGEGGNDVLLGNAGADFLFGGNGNDMLTGGLEIDFLYGEGGEDLMIGGTTTSDFNVTAMRAAINSWGSGANLTARRSNTAATFNAATLRDDGAADYLFGGIGADLELDYALRDLFLDFVASSGDRKN